MVIQFDELAKLRSADTGRGLGSLLTILWNIADFYFWKLFLIFIYLSGIIPVVAAAFTLMRLSRFNETVALLAAGVPLVRVAVPIFAAGLVLSLLAVIDQELIIPRIIPKLIRAPHEAGQIANKSFALTGMQDEAGRIIVAGVYRSGPDVPHMEWLSIIERDAEHRPISHLRSSRAEWDARHQHWVLSDDAVRITGLLPDEDVRYDHDVRIYQSRITPDEIALFWDRDYIALLSTSKINQLLRHESYGRADLLKVKHARLTQWVMGLIVLVLAVSCVLTREPGRLRHAAIKCVMLTGAAMGTMFVMQQITIPADGAWANRWPLILAWLPVFIFGPIAIVLLDRIKT
jgi:lipopolysaccharide export LptBFGC system permease protein LptF